jgi:hypothetical protein
VLQLGLCKAQTALIGQAIFKISRSQWCHRFRAKDFWSLLNQVMAIIPAHMMRSSAGEYDNEAVAAVGSAILSSCGVERREIS